VFDEHASRTFAFLLEAVAFWLHGGVVVCSANEGNDEVLDRGEELGLLLVNISSGYQEWILTSFSSSARWRPSSWVAVGRDGIEDPLVDMVYQYILDKNEIASPLMI